MSDFEHLVGATVADAKDYLETRGLRLRLYSVDKQPMIITADYRIDRVNVHAVTHDDVRYVQSIAGIG